MYEKELENVQNYWCKCLMNFQINYQNLPFKSYFDNLFTDVPLLNYSNDRGYRGTRTIPKKFKRVFFF